MEAEAKEDAAEAKEVEVGDEAAHNRMKGKEEEKIAPSRLKRRLRRSVSAPPGHPSSPSLSPSTQLRLLLLEGEVARADAAGEPEGEEARLARLDLAIRHAGALRAAGRLKEAFEAYDGCLGRLRAMGRAVGHSARGADANVEMAETAIEQGKYTYAYIRLRHAIRVIGAGMEGLAGAELARARVRLASAHNLMGRSRLLSGRYGDAIKAFGDAMALVAAAQGDCRQYDAPPPLSAMCGLASALMAQCDLRQAAVVVSEVRSHAGRLRGDGSRAARLSRADAAQRHGELLGMEGRLEEACASFEEACAELEAAHGGARHPDLAMARHALGRALAGRGRYARAMQMFRRALLTLKATRGDEHPSTATVLASAARVVFEQGRPAEAKAILDKVLRVREKVLGARHPDVADAMGQAAAVRVALSDVDEAARMYRRAVRAQTDALGPGHPEVAHLAVGMAEIFRLRGDVDEAAPIFRAAAETFEAHGMRVRAAQARGGLGACHLRLGNSGVAAELFRRQAEELRDTVGAAHPAWGDALAHVAAAEHARGGVAAARGMLASALVCMCGALGAAHPRTLAVSKTLKLVEEQEEEKKK